MDHEDYDDDFDDFFPEIDGEGRPEMCRNCAYDCAEPGEDGWCPLMRQ